jgi:hypothetical protein
MDSAIYHRQLELDHLKNLLVQAKEKQEVIMPILLKFNPVLRICDLRFLTSDPG